MPEPCIRILLFDLPPLLRDLVSREFDADEDMTSVVAASGGLERAVADHHPDAVIVPLDQYRLPPESRELLENRARLRVLGLDYRDGRSVLYELRPDRSDLGEVAPAELPGLIRSALGREVDL